MISILYAWCLISFIYTVLWFSIEHSIPDKENGVNDYTWLSILICIPTLIAITLFFVLWNQFEKLIK